MSTATDMAEKAMEIADLLKLLGNPNRLMIACRLLDGEISVGDIETELGIKQPTLSRELARLRDDGIIQGRRQSKVVFYSLSHPQMERLIRAICAASNNKPVETPNLATRRLSVPNFFGKPKFTKPRKLRSGGFSQFASVEPQKPKPQSSQETAQE